jgi:rhodanese-related sulfurtransferase
MNRAHGMLGIIAAMLGFGAAASDLRPPASVSEIAREVDTERDHITAIELAERIAARDSKLEIFDLRSKSEYAELHVPTAKHATLNDIAHARFSPAATIVLYSEGGAHSAQAWVLLRMRGYRNVFFLREGIYEWISRVREPRLALDATAAERDEFERAAELSRFFGGVPISGVPRSEVPLGYWTAPAQQQPAAAQQAVARVRRRGC